MTFQFLLVRLKERGSKAKRKARTISIPSGTIKRPDSTRQHQEAPISIPSGTIKRYYFDSNKVFAAKFQFLLVRLKGCKDTA